MVVQHPCEEVQALFGELQALEVAMVQNQRAQLAALDDCHDASRLCSLSAEGELLEERARMVTARIQRLVMEASARAVFAGQRQ